MKTMREGDKPKTGWRKKWDEMPPEKKEQTKTRIITGVLVVIIAILVIRQLLPEKPAQTPDTTPSQEETQTPEEQPGQPVEEQNTDIFNRADIQPDANPDRQSPGDNYTDSAGTAYFVIEPGEEHNKIAHMYVPPAYKAQPITGGVQLLLADLDPMVDGTEPVLFTWNRNGWYHTMFERDYYDMVAEEGVEGFTKFDYTKVDQYMTCGLDGEPWPVYIIHMDKFYDDAEEMENPYYTAEYIILGIPSKTDRYFVGTADNYAVQSLFTTRYPDIQSLARAIFPEYNGHPDAGGKTLPEPEQTDPTVNDGEETPPPDAVIDDPTIPEVAE